MVLPRRNRFRVAELIAKVKRIVFMAGGGSIAAPSRRSVALEFFPRLPRAHVLGLSSVARFAGSKSGHRKRKCPTFARLGELGGSHVLSANVGHPTWTTCSSHLEAL